MCTIDDLLTYNTHKQSNNTFNDKKNIEFGWLYQRVPNPRAHTHTRLRLEKCSRHFGAQSQSMHLKEII